MITIRKIGNKQWGMIVLSSMLAISSLFIPLSNQITESPSFAVADVSDFIPVPQSDRSYRVRVAAPYSSSNIDIRSLSI